MKIEKHWVMAGLGDAEQAQIVAFARQQAKTIEHAWRPGGEGACNLVIVDLEQFAGRVARIRAIEERRALAVVADAGAETLSAELVLRRPFAASDLVDLLNRAGGDASLQRGPQHGFEGVTRIEIAAPRADADAAPVDSAAKSLPGVRASFENPARERVCTNLDELLARGCLLIERANMPALALDPANDSYVCAAPLSSLEGYFLTPVKASETRTLSNSRLADMRRTAAPLPLARLRWLGAMLRSNGWLASHLDPGGTYRIKSWLPMDGEYRKQWRIATTLLRPAPLNRIAATANATMADVFDVVNAYDRIDLLEWTPRRSRHAPPEPLAAAPGERRASARTMRSLLAATVFPR